MILFANFIGAVARIVHSILMIYIFIIIARVFFSWISIPSLRQVAIFVYYLTEPVLKPCRRLIPPYRLGGIDVSPIIVILVIMFVDSVFVESLSAYAKQLLEGQTKYY